MKAGRRADLPIRAMGRLIENLETVPLSKVAAHVLLHAIEAHSYQVSHWVSFAYARVYAPW
jgi:hypothetical protein